MSAAKPQMRTEDRLQAEDLLYAHMFHGGANERVMDVLAEVGSPANAERR